MSLEENTLMSQGNKILIVKWKMLTTRKLGIFFIDFSQPILENDILRK